MRTRREFALPSLGASTPGQTVENSTQFFADQDLLVLREVSHARLFDGSPLVIRQQTRARRARSSAATSTAAATTITDNWTLSGARSYTPLRLSIFTSFFWVVKNSYFRTFLTEKMDEIAILFIEVFLWKIQNSSLKNVDFSFFLLIFFSWQFYIIATDVTQSIKSADVRSHKKARPKHSCMHFSCSFIIRKCKIVKLELV